MQKNLLRKKSKVQENKRLKKINDGIISLMKKFFLPILLCVTICSSSLAASSSSLDKTINQLIKHNLPNASFGIAVADAKSGKVLYDLNGFRAFIPASNLKLFTAAAALTMLGPKHVYSTTININPKQLKKHQLNGNLYIKFTGDPSLTVNGLKNLVAKIKKYGIKKINGKIIIDDTRFQKPYYPPGFTIDDMNWSYCAPITAVMLNENAVTFTFLSSNKLDYPVKIIPGNHAKLLKTEGTVKTVTTTKAWSRCELLMDVTNKNVVQLGGCWPISKRNSNLRIAIKNPNLFAEKIILNQLKQDAVQYKGKIITGKKTPSNFKTIADRSSPTLDILIESMLKNSDNVIANSLTKTLGWKYYHKGTFQAGANAIKGILNKSTNIDFSKTNIYEGAGSHYNLIAPNQIARLLFVVYHTPQLKKVYMKALPIAGKDGTLRRRMKSFDLAEQVNAKTGTISGVSTLSGYLNSQKNETLVFVIMINNIVGSKAGAKKLESKILEKLAAI
jgi:serine-type D-Ala-D-Ala carboxypeptidase/endopeptidase (penicillin-binding protein 4)